MINRILGFGSPWIGSNPPPPPPPPPRSRLHIDGPRIMDGNVEFIGRGTVTGHGEIWRPGDGIFLKSRRANLSRDGVRWWGDYGQGFQVDSEFDLSPGYMNENYRLAFKQRIKEKTDAGLRILFFPDSNCGQGIGGEACKITGGVDIDFFMPEGADKRKKFIDMACYVVQDNLGRIDIMECLVEPSGHATRTTLQQFQEDMMNAILDVDPAMLFLIGGTPGYFANQISNCYKSDWGAPWSRFRNKIAITGNYLSPLATNPVTRANRIAIAVKARKQWNVPILIQQVGTMHGADPDNIYLNQVLDDFRNAEGGPFGWTWWEEFSVFGPGPGSQAYGWWYLSNPNDPNSARLTVQARLDALTAQFQA